MVTAYGVLARQRELGELAGSIEIARVAADTARGALDTVERDRRILDNHQVLVVVALGVTSMIVVQALVNMSVVLGLTIGLMDYVLQVILVDGVARLAR